MAERRNQRQNQYTSRRLSQTDKLVDDEVVLLSRSWLEAARAEEVDRKTGSAGSIGFPFLRV